MPDKNGYPPDHWQVVIKEDRRMESDGLNIRYSDGPLSMLEVMIRRESGETISAPPQKLSREQGQKIYRLKAELALNPKIWRKIEIQGRQTLADLDEDLRCAFNHDPYDHLGGFWKLIPRGTKKKRGGIVKLIWEKSILFAREEKRRKPELQGSA